MTIFNQFQLIGDPALSTEMARYMRNQFPFTGLKTPERKRQSKELMTASKKIAIPELLTGIVLLFQREEREYQYVAIDLMVANVKRLTFADIQELAKLVTQKSWWDTVDALRKAFGDYIRLYPNEKRQVFELFNGADNFWLRRVAITLQLMEKEKTDTKMLTEAILPDIDTPEFFIQKAIGWALRNYSKVDPQWVGKFMASHQLTRLATREGSKYLGNQAG
ncbi:DNA alkylation repair protein [Lactobacillus sp. LC28-10]|uniref:DNA alkylation repair protein n=1 Tax=Secundilactobacillus angelensis TaxID=2722706 RepID=A0ABX1KXB1_9LACO|nr:DNA alkylation repair protein [Secundilactobacillus angelensis]MCH5461565.1 DNA alkylation repair protein [Secundilactobacillus angelensis]NLR17860.1 DNA alkylation repair protein [Secundilactobacillus angelensis]